MLLVARDEQGRLLNSVSVDPVSSDLASMIDGVSVDELQRRIRRNESVQVNHGVLFPQESAREVEVTIRRRVPHNLTFIVHSLRKAAGIAGNRAEIGHLPDLFPKRGMERGFPGKVSEAYGLAVLADGNRPCVAPAKGAAEVTKGAVLPYKRALVGVSDDEGPTDDLATIVEVLRLDTSSAKAAKVQHSMLSVPNECSTRHGEAGTRSGTGVGVPNNLPSLIDLDCLRIRSAAKRA